MSRRSARNTLALSLLIALAAGALLFLQPATAQRLGSTPNGGPLGGGIPLVTTTRDGLMRHADKSKLDGLPSVSSLTLKSTYANGASVTDQTLAMTNTKGALTLDGHLISTGATVLQVTGTGGAQAAITADGDLITLPGSGPTGGRLLPRAGTWRDVYTARGLSDTGLTTPTVFYSAFPRCVSTSLCGEWSWTTTGSGVVSQPTNVKGGVVQINTAATAASQAGLLTVTSGATAWTLSTAGESWYFAARMRLTTTPDAQTYCGIGLLNVAQTREVIIGVAGSESTTKYVLRTGTSTYAGTRQSALSTVTIDTGWHTFEAWNPAGTSSLRLSVDGETAVSLTATTVAADASYPFIECNNNTTAAAQTLQVDEAIYMNGIN